MLTPITRLIALLALSLSYQVTVVAEDLSTEASIAAKIQAAIPQLPITTVSACSLTLKLIILLPEICFKLMISVW